MARFDGSRIVPNSSARPDCPRQDSAINRRAAVRVMLRRPCHLSTTLRSISPLRFATINLVLARNTLALLLTSTAFAQVPPVDWKKQEAEILRHYRGLIQI